MKISKVTGVMLLVTTIAYAQDKPTPEEAHVYWSNKVTNNNNGETTAEFHSESSVRAAIALDEEAYNQLKEQLIIQLKEELKKDPEFKKQLIQELLNDPTFRELLTHVLTPQGTFIRFGM